MRHNVKLMTMTAVLSSVLMLSECSAMSTAIKKHNLEVKTQISEIIWSEPSSQKAVYLQIKNASNKDISSLQVKVTRAVQDKGYTITLSLDSAHCRIQASVLKTDKMDLRTAQGLLSQSYEGAIAGATSGAGITGYDFSLAGTTLGAGLAAGLVGVTADAMVGDINYTMVTDVQISEKTTASVQTDNVAALKQDTSGYEIQASTRTGNQHKYQARVVSPADKANLEFEEAKPVLEDQLAKSVANIL